MQQSDTLKQKHIEKEISTTKMCKNNYHEQHYSGLISINVL